MSRSRRTAVRSPAGSPDQIPVAEAIGPDPLGGGVPAMETRSFIRVTRAPRQPSPTSLRRSESGIRTSVKYTSLNSASPVICRSGRTSTPGACMSTTK
jgi:hypothetical protein